MKLTISTYSQQLGNWLQTSIRNFKAQAKSDPTRIEEISKRTIEEYGSRINKDYENKIEPNVTNKIPFANEKNAFLQLAEKKIKVEASVLLENRNKENNNSIFILHHS